MKWTKKMKGAGKKAAVTVTAVSYTHLDVYKRQGLFCSADGRFYISLGRGASRDVGTS